VPGRFAAKDGTLNMSRLPQQITFERRSTRFMPGGKHVKVARAAVTTIAISLSTVAAMAQTGNIVATGTFHGAAHKTSGRATVYQSSNGDILRLTHFETSNGPNLHVILIAGASKDFSLGSIPSVDLGDLKGNQGDQDYPIPNADNLQQLNTVSIYCERFHANFGTAPLDAF
jgi:hypothetical protein